MLWIFFGASCSSRSFPSSDKTLLGLHQNKNSLKFLTGKSANYREIDVIQRVSVIEIHKCQGLIGLHHFTGAVQFWRFPEVLGKLQKPKSIQDSRYFAIITKLTGQMTSSLLVVDLKENIF